MCLYPRLKKYIIEGRNPMRGFEQRNTALYQLYPLCPLLSLYLLKSLEHDLSCSRHALNMLRRMMTIHFFKRDQINFQMSWGIK